MRRFLLPCILLSVAASVSPASPAAVRTFDELSAMVPVPGGTFRMGDHLGDGSRYELPVHQVTVSPFSMMKYEVSWGVWIKVRAWALDKGYEISQGAIGGGFPERLTKLVRVNPDDPRSPLVPGRVVEFPVTEVSWFDCVAWCNAWSVLEGKTPCYYGDKKFRRAIQKFRRVDDPVFVKWDADGYRLPTEAEWEYAARAGGRLWRFGDGTDMADAGRINFNAALRFGKQWVRGDLNRGMTLLVGSLGANALGLYDMSGNVWEWCWDMYDPYPAAPQADPRGLGPGPLRVYRGGSFINAAINIRATYRDYLEPERRDYNHGFRVVRVPR